MRTFLKPMVASFLMLIMLVSCKKDNDSDDTEVLTQDVLEQYAKIVYTNYDDAHKSAVQLKTVIDAFALNPSAEAFQDCKDAWLIARTAYGQTEAFRFYGGPIDGEDGPEGYINAWPIDESFVDYVTGNPDAGIINNTTEYPVLSKELLLDLNESISETSIFTGYHAIEFLLWGQDFNTSGPGERAYTDYLEGAGSTAPNAARRIQYLQIVTDLLVEQLAWLKDQWKSDGDYRAFFTNELPKKEALTFIITGMGELAKGELAGERMFVAIDTKDQENEHSCFSDNTINDIKLNLKGIYNVYLGEYTRLDGTKISGKGIRELIQKSDAETAQILDAAFVDAISKVNDIPAPFDQTIVNNPASVIPAIESLRDLSDYIVEGGLKIGVVL